MKLELIHEADTSVMGKALGTMAANLGTISKYAKEEAAGLVEFFKKPTAEKWDSYGKKIVGGIVRSLKAKAADIKDPEERNALMKEMATWVELAGVPGAGLIAALFDVPDALARRSFLRQWDLPDAMSGRLKRILGPKGFIGIVNAIIKYPAIKDRLVELVLSVEKQMT